MISNDRKSRRMVEWKSEERLADLLKLAEVV